MRDVDRELEELARAMGVRVEYAALPPDRDGEYRHHYRTIRLRRGMTARHHRSVFAHELCHAVFEDVPSRFGPVNAKHERRADEWAALRLISPAGYRDAEHLHGAHPGAMAVELGVTRSIIAAYQRVLLRVNDVVYEKPAMGAGQWTHREEIAS